MAACIEADAILCDSIIMVQHSPCKTLRSIKRMTKFAETKHLLSPKIESLPILKSKPSLTIVHLERTNIPSQKSKLSIKCVETTTIPPFSKPKRELSIVHVQTTTVPPQPRSLPKLSIVHVQSTTVPPRPSPKLTIVHVQTTTVLPQPRISCSYQARRDPTWTEDFHLARISPLPYLRGFHPETK